MEKVKIAIVFYSATGTNYRMALAVKKGAEVAGAEVRLRKVRELAPTSAIESNPAWKANLEVMKEVVEVTHSDMEWADAYIFGTPTRFGNMASQLKQFIDTCGPLWVQGKLANKVVSGFTSAQNAHGGQESTLLTLYNVVFHWGCFIVPPGYTDPAYFAAGGNPYGVSVNAAPGGNVPDEALEAAEKMAARVAQVTGWIKKGQGK